VSAARGTFRRHHLIALVPVIWVLGAPWFANRIEPFVLGMPFLLAWIVIGTLLSSATMALLGAIDRRQP
jgi:Protein of unknown function (DUF3311)